MDDLSGIGPDVDELVHLNGINGLTGLPLIMPFTPAAIAAHAWDELHRSRRAWRFGRALRLLGFLNIGRLLAQGPHLGLPDDDEIDATDPRSVGWAIAVAADASTEVVSAADRLYDHRLRQTGVPGDRCKRLTFPAGCPLNIWLKTMNAHAADIVPTRLPYYVTLVGGPQAIPFEVQAELNVHYAVGRLAFDEPAAYGRYVDSLIDYEMSDAVPGSREVVYWGTRNRNDRATALSADCLVRPLYAGLPEADGQPAVPAIAGLRKFCSRCLLGSDATREQLLGLLHNHVAASPSVLFTASHGLGWPKGHVNQYPSQGALLCQDWPGPGIPPRPPHCLTEADLDDDARVHGLVAFLFACYGAGTPEFDHFPLDRSRGPAPIADRPFVAALPQRLLSHPGGAALAVVGHVERAWGCSIRPHRLGPSILPFRNFLSRVLRGEPVGHATRDFGDRFTAASVSLLEAASTARGSSPSNEADLAAVWVERNDSRNYVLLGDPAARLRVEKLSKNRL